MYLVTENALYENQAPRNNNRLNRIRESMCLIRPSNIRRRHHHYSHALLSLVGHQLVNRPIFKYETDEKHEDAQGVEDDLGSDLSVVT